MIKENVSRRYIKLIKANTDKIRLIKQITQICISLKHFLSIIGTKLFVRYHFSHLRSLRLYYEFLSRHEQVRKIRHTNGRERSNQAGLTLIELTIAMVASSILLFTIFYTWGYIDKYTNKSKHRTMIEKETERIGSTIASQIRRSTEIIFWDENRIEMVNPNGSDTLAYYFDHEKLLLNNDTVRVLVNDAKVKQFKLMDIDYNEGKEKKSMLLDLTLSVESKGGDSASSHHIIQLSQTPQQKSIEGNWGF